MNKHLHKITHGHFGGFVALLVIGLISVVGGLVMNASQAATGGALSITPATATQAPGTTFTVAVQAASGANPINTVQAAITYNTAQLQYVSMTEGTAFPTIAATNTNTAGIIRIARGTASNQSVTGTQTVVNITFKVIATSGTAALGFDSSTSFMALAADGTNMLSTVTGATISVQAPTSSGILSLSPASGSYAPGNNIAVTINEDSTTVPVNAVQATIKYDAAKLQFVSITNGTTFTTVAATDTGTAGTVRLARGLPGNTSATGVKAVATINFKVLGTAPVGTSAVTFDRAGSFIARASDATDVLGSTTSASYNITATPVVAPTITSLAPLTGSTAGATSVTITGANFVSGATVSFDTTVVSGANVTYVSATSLRAIAPAHAAGTVAVAVTNPDGQKATKAAAYSYVVPAPTISSISPTTGPVSGGTAITISGTNFVSGATVMVNGLAATSIVVVNATTITAKTPASAAGSVPISVTNPGGAPVTKTAAFNFTALPGDANNDGRVNAIDLSILITHDAQNYPAADFNGDGTVGSADMAILLGRWTW